MLDSSVLKSRSRLCSGALLKAVTAIWLLLTHLWGLMGQLVWEEFSGRIQSPDENCSPSVIFVACLFCPFQAFPDNAARREVESLPAVCINSGCNWKGTIKEYEVQAKARLDTSASFFPLCLGKAQRVVCAH